MNRLGAGDLLHRITIKRQMDVPDGKGAFDRSWVELGRCWAKVVSINGREALIAGVLQGISTFVIFVRFRSDLQPSDQILWNGRELNIHSAEDADGRRTWTKIIASTEAPQGA